MAYNCDAVFIKYKPKDRKQKLRLKIFVTPNLTRNLSGFTVNTHWKCLDLSSSSSSNASGIKIRLKGGISALAF